MGGTNGSASNTDASSSESSNVMSNSISGSLRAAMVVACDNGSPPTRRNLLVGARVAGLSKESQTCAILPLKSAFADAGISSQ